MAGDGRFSGRTAPHRTEWHWLPLPIPAAGAGGATATSTSNATSRVRGVLYADVDARACGLPAQGVSGAAGAQVVNFSAIIGSFR